MFCLLVYICTTFILVPLEVGRKCQSPWNWSCGWLGATMWLLVGTEPGTSPRAKGTLWWALSPTPHVFRAGSQKLGVHQFSWPVSSRDLPDPPTWDLGIQTQFLMLLWQAFDLFNHLMVLYSLYSECFPNSEPKLELQTKLKQMKTQKMFKKSSSNISTLSSSTSCQLLPHPPPPPGLIQEGKL